MPTQPKPSATLVLLRDAPGLEVLLIQRHQASRFAGGDFVFPGGKIEADENPDGALASCRGLTATDAARRLALDDPRAAAGYWIGAIREAFEEVGVLLAYGPDGQWVKAHGPRFADHRRACQLHNRAFWDMVQGERLTLATDRLVYFAHWITPEESPFRFDTRFFAAEAPPGHEAVPDHREIVDVRWAAPQAALDAAARGEISVRFPTMTNLSLLLGSPSVAGVLRTLASRQVTPIRPRVVTESGVRRVLVPGDPGYF